LLKVSLLDRIELDACASLYQGLNAREFCQTWLGETFSFQWPVTGAAKNTGYIRSSEFPAAASAQ